MANYSLLGVKFLINGMKRTIYIFILLIFSFVTTGVGQNSFTNAVKDGVNAVKEGVSPLTSLFSKKDSATLKSKQKK